MNPISPRILHLKLPPILPGANEWTNHILADLLYKCNFRGSTNEASCEVFAIDGFVNRGCGAVE